jgi:hypothetical protein
MKQAYILFMHTNLGTYMHSLAKMKRAYALFVHTYTQEKMFALHAHIFGAPGLDAHEKTRQGLEEAMF